MKKYLFGILAIVFAASLVAFTTVSEDKGSMLDKYFKYTPSLSGQEDVESVWQEIDLTEYNSAGCNSLFHGCRIKTNRFVETFSGSGVYIPEQVNVTTHSNGTKTPIADGTFVQQRKLKDAAQ